MKIYTRIEPEAIWSGYWDVVISIRGNFSSFGDVGMELAVKIGSIGFAYRSQSNGTWSDWTKLQ